MFRRQVILLMLMVFLANASTSNALPVTSSITYNVNFNNISWKQIQNEPRHRAFQFAGLVDIPKFDSLGGLRTLKNINFLLETNFTILSIIEGNQPLPGTTTHVHSSAFYGPLGEDPISDPFTIPSIYPPFLSIGATDSLAFSLDPGLQRSHLTAQTLTGEGTRFPSEEFVGDGDFTISVQAQNSIAVNLPSA